MCWIFALHLIKTKNRLFALDYISVAYYTHIVSEWYIYLTLCHANITANFYAYSNKSYMNTRRTITYSLFFSVAKYDHRQQQIIIRNHLTMATLFRLQAVKLYCDL